MIEISKELLSEVLNEEVNESIILEGSVIKYSYKYLGYAEINIYELAFKFKEWALSSEFKIYSCAVKDGGKCNIHKVFKSLNTTPIDITLRGKSEVEAIIKSCQWILDNKEKIK